MHACIFNAMWNPPLQPPRATSHPSSIHASLPPPQLVPPHLPGQSYPCPCSAPPVSAQPRPGRLVNQEAPPHRAVAPTQVPNHAFSTDGARVTTTTSNDCSRHPPGPPAAASTLPSASASPPPTSPARDGTALVPSRWDSPTTP